MRAQPKVVSRREVKGDACVGVQHDVVGPDREPAAVEVAIGGSALDGEAARARRKPERERLISSIAAHEEPGRLLVERWKTLSIHECDKRHNG